MSLLSGANAIVTGASRGLGRHIATAMWESGANLLLTARSVDDLKALKDELLACGAPSQQVLLVTADLSCDDGVREIVNAARRAWSKVDVLVNNAGIQGPIGPVWEIDWDEWLRTMQINLHAPVALCRALVPWMRETGGGSIINLSGGGATGPRPHFAAYAVAKTGIVRFTEILAQEVSEFNIRVNSIAPGALNTDMLRVVLEAGPEKVGSKEFAQARKQSETGGSDPRRAAALCVFLASPSSVGITGKLLSALWDPWSELPRHLEDLTGTDLYALRRIVPKDRDKNWG
jgi:NAD(P)-dependent dehydrogenase (short-subunit alcohol dehydrogenase family)